MAIFQLIAAIPFLTLAVLALGLAAAPAFWIFQWISQYGSPDPYLLWKGLGFGAAFYTFGLALLIVAPVLNFLLWAYPKPYRGPAVSIKCLNWYLHNALTLLVRYAFLEFVTPTEFAKIYYRLMGMKMGKNVYINSTAIADPSLIILEDGVTIGGSASVMAHYSQGGFMVIAPVLIKKGATIGYRATVMGGVEVGEKAKIMANSFVLPNSKIPDGETWGGIPAVKIELKKTPTL